MFAAMKNRLILDVLEGKRTHRAPVWMMRQAGRTLPEYLEIRKTAGGFRNFVQSPKLTAEATVQPIDRYDLDAAILFSDILVIPEALGFDYDVIEKKGPVFNETLRTKELTPFNGNIDKVLGYVGDSIELTKDKLDNRVPLLGFAGAPFTILCYMIEGGGSKTFSNTRKFLYQNPKKAHEYLDIISDITIEYLTYKISKGVNAVQLFDSWAGILGKDQFLEFSLPYLNKIINKLPNNTPKILFAKGAWFALKEMSETNCNVVGIDWNTSPDFALANTIEGKGLQGNLDPALLYASDEIIISETQKMIEAFKKRPYIANLGHGIYPDTDFKKAKVFVDCVKNYNY